MKLDVKTLDGSASGSIDLAEAIFGLPVRKDLLARMVNYQLAKRRAGTHKTKIRSEVKATSKKMYAQKGTGQARHGNQAAPQFRGGGKAFGPVVRDHAHEMPKKVRKLALKTALSAKQAEGKLVVLETASLQDAKTAKLAASLGKLGLQSVLVIDGPEVNENFSRAARNIAGVDVLPQQGANVYDILRRDTLILTREAVKHLEERLK
jgi:large subunit ribosomal protein L4